MSVEQNVQARYSDGAKTRQEDLCCPVNYRQELLEMLPREIIDKDYGCGDPSRYVREGDVVLDLGSGGGKICYVAAQLVGDRGHVYGVDMTDDMLALARKYQAEMADKLGQSRVTFHKGYIQNLAFDMDAASRYAQTNPITDAATLADYETWKLSQQKLNPMIADASISLVISNCVLNLVDRVHRRQLFQEVFRVLKPGGRIAISDIVSDRVVPNELQQDPELWSGCISGAFQEQDFLQAFVDAGFVNVTYDKWDRQAWRVVSGIEFRSVTVVATKPLREEPVDSDHALMFVGPFRHIEDDFGTVYPRGVRVRVDKSIYNVVLASEYSESFVGFEPDKENGSHSACHAQQNFNKKSCC